jgi:hypothetical protein
MSKSVRGTLLIIAAVLGVTQLSIVYKYIDSTLFVSSLVSFPEKVAIALLVPVAICGVLAASLMRNTSMSRLFAALAAGIMALTVLIPEIYFSLKYAGLGETVSSNASLTFANLKYTLGFFAAEDYSFISKWIQLMGTIALILWIICAAFPAKKGSETSSGAPAFGGPNAMPANPVTSYAPAPVTSAPVVPAATQGAKFCTNCGKPLVGVAKFCAECGTPT